MLVKDTEALERTVKQDAIERQREMDQRMLSHTLESSYLYDDKTNSPVNPERQMGKPMHSDALERIIKQLNPHVHIYKEKDRHAIYAKAPTINRSTGRPTEASSKDLVCVYQVDTPLPEWSIMAAEKEEVPDYDRLLSGEPLRCEELYEAQRNGTARPGWKFVWKPYCEIRRGWRTVLARMVQHGLTHADAVERLVGGANRVSWAANIGKQTAGEISPF